MAKIQYAYTTSSVAPFHRMIRFTNGVPGVVAPPPMAVPIALRSSAWSPDNKYLIAAAPGSSTTPFRLWTMTDLDQWAEIILPAQAAARTVTGIAWVTNTHLSFTCSATGAWFGVFDRTAGTITWTNLNTTGWNGVTVEPNNDGQFFIVYRIATAVQYAIIYQRTGDTATIAANGGSNIGSMNNAMFFPDGTTFLYSTPASQFVIYPRKWDRSSKLITNASFNYVAADGPNRGVSGNGDATCVGISPDSRIIFSSVNYGPRLFKQRLTDARRFASGATTVRRVVLDDDPTITPLAAAANNIVTIGDDKIMVSIPSNALNTGRARAFNYKTTEWDLVEETALSALFSDWSAAINWISTSSEFVGGASTSLYNTAPESIVGDTVNLNSLKAALVSSAGAFNAAHTTAAQALGANEVYGSSWPQGGIACSTASYEKVGTGSQYAIKVPIPAFDLATAGSLTFRGVVIYDSITSQPLAYIDLGADKTAVQFDRLLFSSTNNRLALFETVNT